MSNSLTSVASAARAATMTHVSDVVKITICLLIFRSVVGCDRKEGHPACKKLGVGSLVVAI